MRETTLTTGCQLSPTWLYCPWTKLPREQAVIFALKMKYGNGYLPPAATGTVFADMTDPNYYATSWAEKAYADGLITILWDERRQAEDLPDDTGYPRAGCVYDCQGQEPDDAVRELSFGMKCRRLCKSLPDKIISPHGQVE